MLMLKILTPPPPAKKTIRMTARELPIRIKKAQIAIMRMMQLQKSLKMLTKNQKTVKNWENLSSLKVAAMPM